MVACTSESRVKSRREAIRDRHELESQKQRTKGARWDGVAMYMACRSVRVCDARRSPRGMMAIGAKVG